MRVFQQGSILLLFIIAIVPAAVAQRAHLLGFADVNYVATEVEGNEGFDLGQLAGHAAFVLSDRVTVFSEVSLTARSTGYMTEVERLLLRYDFSDLLKISAGRYHTPISYWNTAYHHGLWLQTTVGRPEYTTFGSRFVPVHFVGLLAEGSLPTSRLGPSYFAGVGNGRAGEIARAGDAGDVNNARAWLAGMFVRPASLYGLQLGLAIYRDRIGEEAAAQVDETIYAAHVVWEKERPELIAEYARVFHDPQSGAGSWNGAFYVQAAYRLPGAGRAFMPYVRYEKIEAPPDDPVFGGLSLEYDAIIAGVRYDFAPQAALKVEFRNEEFEDADRANGLYLQASFTFPGAEVARHYDPTAGE